MDVLKDHVLELGPTSDSPGLTRNFKLTRDSDGIAWLLFDCDGASANTLSADVLANSARSLRRWKANVRPGWLFIPAKPSGLIAGADVNEFRGDGRSTHRWKRRNRPRAHAVIDRFEALRIPKRGGHRGTISAVVWKWHRLQHADRRHRQRTVTAFFGRAGLHTGLGGTARFTHMISPLEAMTLMLTGRTIDARRAKSLGLVDAVTQERHVREAL